MAGASLLFPPCRRTAGIARCRRTAGHRRDLHHQSKALGETRRINVYRPQPWGLDPKAPLPVLYMPDGGIGEDFLHVAGLVQVLTGNGSMRPFLLVGIENTERRRDMTGPSSDPQDQKIAPRIGGSAAYRTSCAMN
jgi:enterochelin esterase-like enzyme